MSGRDAFPLATSLARTLRDAQAALQLGEPNEMVDKVTPTTAELLKYWFQNDFCDVRGLNFHAGQRQAILAIIYAHEVIGAPTLRQLYQDVAPDALLGGGLLAELSNPRHAHPKYAAKMATGLARPGC